MPLLGLARDSVLSLSNLAKENNYVKEDVQDNIQQRRSSDKLNNSNRDKRANQFVEYLAPTDRSCTNEAQKGLASIDIEDGYGAGLFYDEIDDEDKRNDISVGDLGSQTNRQHSALGMNSDYGTHLDSYVDPYSSSNVKGGSNNQRSVFCCLFAPWNTSANNHKAQKEHNFADDNKDMTRSDVKKGLDVESGMKKYEKRDMDNSSQSSGKENIEPIVDTKATNAKTESHPTSPRQPNDGMPKKILDDTMAEVHKVQSSHHLQSIEGARTKDPTPSSSPSSEFKRGILKRKGSMLPSKGHRRQDSNRFRQSTITTSSKTSTSDDVDTNRRSLFPSARYTGLSGAGSNSDRSTIKKTIQFAKMAKFTTVTSRHDMSPIELQQIWWTKADYDDFKKTARVITRALLEGGSEIWLQNEGRQNKSKLLSELEEEDTDDDGGKWWCKFGHSRRGLEHVASAAEGTLRQTSVANAIRSVLREQDKQRLTGQKDPHRISLVCQQYTTWARQLALTAGKADAEAVRTNFTSDKGSFARSCVASDKMYSTSLTKNPSARNEDDLLLTTDILDAYTASTLLAKEKENKKISPPFKITSPGERDSRSAQARKNNDSSTVKTEVLGTEEADLPEAPEAQTGKGVGSHGKKSSTSAAGDNGLYGVVPEGSDRDTIKSERMAKKAAGFGQTEDDGVDLRRFLSKRISLEAMQ